MVMFSVISLHLDNAGEPVLVKVSSYTHLAVTMKTASFAGRVLANVHVDIGSLALFGVQFVVLSPEREFYCLLS